MSGMFNERFIHYMSCNFNFSLQYDKLYKKEYLPSRIRYNQFFFWTFFAAASYTCFSKGMFSTSVGSNPENLGARRYYTSERAVVNPI